MTRSACLSPKFANNTCACQIEPKKFPIYQFCVTAFSHLSIKLLDVLIQFLLFKPYSSHTIDQTSVCLLYLCRLALICLRPIAMGGIRRNKIQIIQSTKRNRNLGTAHSMNTLSLKGPVPIPRKGSSLVLILKDFSPCTSGVKNTLYSVTSPSTESE